MKFAGERMLGAGVEVVRGDPGLIFPGDMSVGMLALNKTGNTHETRELILECSAVILIALGGALRRCRGMVMLRFAETAGDPREKDASDTSTNPMVNIVGVEGEREWEGSHA